MTSMQYCEQCQSKLDADQVCQACLLQLAVSSAPSDPPSMESPPTNLPTLAELTDQFPKLRIQRLIGRGGMGAIYKARQTNLDRDIALKIIANGFSSDPMFVERFEREAKALAKLSHPNIVTVFDSGHTTDGTAYLMMEYIEGLNLREAMRSESIATEDVPGIVCAVCQALEYAHSKGVVHRDIKPENILLGEDGSLKLADFGIAKLIGQAGVSPTLTATRQVLGTLHYLAPEQLESPDQADHRVDIYALGVIFYELLTGRLPIGNFEKPSVLVPGLDHWIDSIVLKALARNPAQRFQQAAELKTEIEQIANRSFSESDSSDGLSNINLGQHTLCVPFHQETMAGFGRVVGSVSATKELVRIEYRLTDNLFQGIKTQLKSVDVPVNQITSFKLKHGVFSSTLSLSVTSARLLGDLPGSEVGRVALEIDRPDRELAKRLLQLTGFSQDSVVAESTHYWNPTQAILLMFCGLLNAGLSGGALLALLDTEIPYGLPLAISVSTILGLLGILQFVSGILHITRVGEFVYRATMIASIAPLSPLIIFTLPLAIWYFLSAREESVVDNQSARASASWGQTTLIMLRENRTARWLSILNLAGIGAVSLGTVLYLTGFYPTLLNYRIVGNRLSAEETATLINARLADASPIDLSIESASRLRIWILQRDSEVAQKHLAIVKPLELVLLQKSGSEASPTDTNNTLAEVRLAKGVAVAEELIHRSAVGDVVNCLQTNVRLKDDFVKGVKVRPQNKPAEGFTLELELTQQGLNELKRLFGGQQGSSLLGLVIDQTMYGVSVDQASTNGLTFAISGTLSPDMSSILAALRGPELPFDLEFLP